MQTTTLGRGGPVVSRAGLGLMGMSGIYGQADDQESLATIHAALDAGITLLDTGDFYGMGHNEMLLRDALRGGRRERAVHHLELRAIELLATRLQTHAILEEIDRYFDQLKGT